MNIVLFNTTEELKILKILFLGKGIHIMILFFIFEIPIIAILFFALGTIGFLSKLGTTFIMIISFILAGLNIVLSVVFLYIGTDKVLVHGTLIEKIRRILSSIFFILFPIMLFAFLLISGKYLNIHYISVLNNTISNIYQNPKVFFVASLTGCSVNLLLMLINILADYLQKRENRLAIIINCLIILLIFLFPVIGKQKALESRIIYCQKQESEKCIVQKDDRLFVAFKTNCESDTVDLKDPIELKFWNYKVKKGEHLYTTDKSYTKKSVTYIEVYNDSVWGYIKEDNIVKEE